MRIRPAGSVGCGLVLLMLVGCGPAVHGDGHGQVRFGALLAAASATATATDRDQAMSTLCDKVATKIEIENAVLNRADLWTGWVAPSPDHVYCPYSTVSTTGPADLTLTVRLVTGGPARVDRVTPTSRVAVRDGVEITATSPTGLVEITSARLRQLLDKSARSIRAQ